MNHEKELQLAKAPYNWLKASPLVTIPTLFFIASIVAASDIFYYFCLGNFNCGSGGRQAMEFGVGVLGSALWHLVLLQYALNKQSGLVREHGRKALLQAGIRTGVALFGVALDWLTEAGGGFACIFIGILLLIWVINATQSKRWVEGDTPPAAHHRVETYNPEFKPLIQPTQDMLDIAFADLDSERDVVVLATIEKLGSFSQVNESILKRLEQLAAEDDNPDVRMDARTALNRLKYLEDSARAIGSEEHQPEQDSDLPAETLNRIHRQIQIEDDILILQAIAKLTHLNYSSAAIRLRLEQLAIHSASPTVRAEALGALGLSQNRVVQRQSASGKLERDIRNAILQEIAGWEFAGLLNKQNADVIRRRYDYDFAPQTPPSPSPVQTAAPTPQAVQPKPLPAQTPAPVAPTQPQVPPEPRPSLLQTLTSEASVKIYLYLGAFFVIAAAAILGAVVESLRLPILMAATLIFGGLAIAIKKRLPQPSFALFIVFSFLLPITGISLEEFLRQSLGLSNAFTDWYWTLLYFVMSLIWAGSARLYESRFFAIAAYVSLTLSFFSAGIAMNVEPPIHIFLLSFAALAGLAWTRILQMWKDSTFALPVFIAAQIVQAVTLAFSIGAFGLSLVDTSSETLLLIFGFGTWTLAAVFYIASDLIQPFFAFSWLACAALIPMPWFLAVAFDLESFGSAILMFVWGGLIAGLSEPLQRTGWGRKFSLQSLLAAMPSLALAILTGFVHEVWLGLAVALGIALLFTLLHILRSRWWLWTLALANFAIAYFALFQLDFIARLDIFFGYQLTGIAILFLLPDLLLKKDWRDNLAWRLPPRIFGVLFAIAASLTLFFPEQPAQAAFGFGVFALFCAAYALLYRKPLLGYISAAYLPLAVIYGLDALNSDAWLPALTGLAVVYYLASVLFRSRAGWGNMLRNSGLAIGAASSLTALILLKETGGWYALVIGSLFLIETYLSRKGIFEIGAPLLFTLGAFLILRDLEIVEVSSHLFAYSLVWIALDTLFHLTFRDARPWQLPVRITGAALTVFNTLSVVTDGNNAFAAASFGIYTLLFLALSLIHRTPVLGYLPAVYLPLAAIFTLEHFRVDAWLPVLTGIAILYFVGGFVLRAREGWSLVFRNSALALGALFSITALILFKETGGWYAIVAGLLFIAEMYLRRNGWFEAGAPALFTLGMFLILRDFDAQRVEYHLLAYSLIWILEDLAAHLTFPNPRPLAWLIRIAGALTALANYGFLFFNSDPSTAAFGFALYALLFLTVSLVYRQPILLYAFTLTLPLFAAFLFRIFGITQWIHPVTGIAALTYAAGHFLRRRGNPNGWDQPPLFSGLALGVIVSGAAPILGGLDASIPVAIAATLWAFEAFSKRNAWLAFPANGLYLLAYFIILFEINVDEPQFFSIGTALFGLIQHYLLTRAEGKTGTFIMGMFSQFVLLGTTYIEMINRNDLNYFFLLFIQSLVILVYGIVIRSRSLTFFPIGFVALGVVTVAYSALKDIGTIFLIGCTGILLLMLGVGAVLLRERIAKLGERLSDWKA